VLLELKQLTQWLERLETKVESGYKFDTTKGARSSRAAATTVIAAASVFMLPPKLQASRAFITGDAASG